jgi:hypothetical protein
MSDVAKAANARQILVTRLRSLATRSTSGALSVGVGVVGTYPFYLSIFGLGITFLTNALIAFQQNIRNDQTKQEPYFIAIMIGLALFVLGLFLSLNQLSELITFVRNAAEVGSERFIWRNAEEEILNQATNIQGLPKFPQMQSTESQTIVSQANIPIVQNAPVKPKVPMVPMVPMVPQKPTVPKMIMAPKESGPQGPELFE